MMYKGKLQQGDTVVLINGRYVYADTRIKAHIHLDLFIVSKVEPIEVVFFHRKMCEGHKTIEEKNSCDWVFYMLHQRKTWWRKLYWYIKRRNLTKGD